MNISHLDHWVLTVADVEASSDFYTKVLGLERIEFGQGRLALGFGNQKINLHPAAGRIEPRARRPQCGSADFCLISRDPLDAVMEHLRACAVPIELGPVRRSGATGALLSVYFRDPDGNLVEVAQLLDPAD